MGHVVTYSDGSRMHEFTEFDAGTERDEFQSILLD